MLRTHTCGQLRAENEGEEVTLAGWIHTIRNHGNVTFIDLRDRYGTTQLVLKDFTAPRESVLQITGTVKRREGSENEKLITGKIEVHVKQTTILSKANTIPIDERSAEESRLKYRYLDLRKQELQQRLITRAGINKAIRDFLTEKEFVELETPILAKSTPEGARDYLVASRTQKGSFYALPQSPQLFKQLFMIAGFDKYFQIVRCFRDEDLRKDRQPEFTQLDMELSFAEATDVMQLNEELAKHLYKELTGEEITTAFPKITYEEAMSTYGTDRPDTRFKLPLQEVTSTAHKSNFNVFTQAEHVVALVVNKELSRKEIDALTEVAKTYHAKGLAYIKNSKEGFSSGISKFVEEIQEELTKKLKLGGEETILFVADKKRVAQTALGAVRTALGEQLELIDTNKNNFLWVTDFPMFEYDEETDRYVSMHHPFTMPKVRSAQELREANYEELLSVAYDLVLNGSEIAGGSVRIHDQEIQQEIFTLLKLSKEEITEKFGFFTEALSYGTPPHAGIAWGLDRFLTMMLKQPSIRDVIAFPKNKQGQDVMMQAPSTVEKEQLEELGLRLQ
ncbi:MAG: aspartate--tRNA ligase [Candidatus Woesearchaeota archaeon]